MKRRHVLFAVCLVAVAAMAALAPRKATDILLLLKWASKAKAETPPVAILLEMGLKDEEPGNWSGKANVVGGKIVHREGYRFRSDDKLIDPDGWSASSHVAIRLPPNRALRQLEPIASVGVVLHIADLEENATITVELENKDKEKVSVPIKEVLAGGAKSLWDGYGQVRRISTAIPLVTEKTEDDFPAAAYGPDGTLWVAYISYHVKEDSRRIEAPQLKEQPADFKKFYTPEFGDQLFVKYYREGQWHGPIEITGPNEDLVRCAIAVDGKKRLSTPKGGTVLVAYSANRNGKHDIYVRPISPRYDPAWRNDRSPTVGPEVRITGSGMALSPLMCTDQEGCVWTAHQEWDKDGLASVSLQWVVQPEKLNRETAWFADSDVKERSQASTFRRGGRPSWPQTLVSDPIGRVLVTYDCYQAGRTADYDVSATRYQRGPDNINLTDISAALPSTDAFEARPAAVYDKHGRLWIAYEEGPERWGKDFGAFDMGAGNPLYNKRNVRVVCLENGKLMKPAAELPTAEGWTFHPEVPVGNLGGAERGIRYAYPRIGIDGKGRIWLTYRVKFGTRYSSHPGSYWLTFARRLDGDQWSEPIEIHHSDGILDHRPVLLPHVNGGLVIVHNTDGRYTTPETIDNQIYVSYIDLPGEPVEPRLVPHEPGKKNPDLVKEAEAERTDVKRIRDYRIEVGGKKYQLLRGEFHRHTELSWDGGPDGSLEDMFRYAIDAAAMDWIGNGDHDNGAGREYSWWLTQKLTDAYHVQKVFTPMFTYERSVSYPHGHRNCMFAQRGVRTLPRLAAPSPREAVAGVHADDTKMLYRYLKEMNGICAVHTSATGMGTDWRDNDPEVEPFVEIYQGDRMSYEYEECPRAGFDPRGNRLPANIGGWQPLGFLNHAFAKGYKLGFQSSSDHWSTHISYCIAVAERHDREAILDAFKKRHCYGATDNIILDVRSGKHVMGDEFQTSSPPSLEIRAIGTKPIATVDILKDSQVVHTFNPGEQEYQGKWTDPNPSPGVHYYYVRVQQADGEIAWGSPMWVDYVK